MAGLGAREIVVLAIVLVVLLLVWRMSSAAQRVGTGKPRSAPLNASAVTTINGCLARGDTAAAVDAYRRQTGAGRAESRRAIAGWRVDPSGRG